MGKLFQYVVSSPADEQIEYTHTHEENPGYSSSSQFESEYVNICGLTPQEKETLFQVRKLHKTKKNLCAFSVTLFICENGWRGVCLKFL